MKKQVLLGFIAVSGLITTGCSMFGKSQPDTIPLPPKNLNSSSPAIMLPQPANTNQGAVAESVAAARAESQPAGKNRQIIENRGPGGAVNKITVDNPGDVPDYYLYPSQQQYNNNPDKISPPSWQYSW